MTEEHRPEGLPTVDELVEGQVYRIRSRNLVVGAWRPEPVNGFVGVRFKFGSAYLFTEYHWDTGGSVGTVTAAEPWLVDGEPLMVPEGAVLNDHIPGSDCSEHDRECYFKEWAEGEGPTEYRGRGRWLHTDDDTELEKGDFPHGRSNDALFALLEPIDAAINEQLRAELEAWEKARDEFEAALTDEQRAERERLTLEQAAEVAQVALLTDIEWGLSPKATPDERTEWHKNLPVEERQPLNAASMERRREVYNKYHELIKPFLYREPRSRR